MNQNTSHNLFLAIRPLLYVSRALGLAPFTYVKKTLPGGTISLQFEQSPAALVYSIFAIALNLCLILFSIVLKKVFVYSNLAETDSLPDMLLHTASITSLVSLALSVTTNRKNILRIMYLMVEIDFTILNSSSKYYKKAIISITAQVFVVFVFFGFKLTQDTITWASAHGPKFLIYGHMYVDTLIEWIVVIQFMNMVVWLKDRFSLLNTHLSILSGILELENPIHLSSPKRTCAIKVKEMKSQLRQKDVLTCNNIHDMLYDTVLLVNSAYEVQILFSIISTFVGATVWLYFALCFLYGYTGADSMGVSNSSFVVCSMTWSLLHVAKLLCITVPCHSAKNKMAQTSTVLRKLLLALHADPGAVTELERFSKQLALRKSSFTVFGFLSLDLSLLFSIMGAVATYLVILMQFKMSMNSLPACKKNVTD
jgi:hypothetical protein